MSQAQRSQFHHRLNWQLAILFCGLAFFFAVIFALATLIPIRSVLDRSLEIQHWSIAQNLAKDLEPWTKGSIDYSKLWKRLDTFAQDSPTFRVFLLDNNGKELPHFSGISLPNSRPTFDRQMLEAALSDKAADPALYLLPYEDYPPVPFSVARIGIGQEQGYLLVILRLNQFDPISALLIENAGVRLLIIIIVFLLLTALAVSYWIFSRFTKRFYELLAAVKSYGQGDFSQRIRIETRNELGELSASVNEMADRILSNINELKRKDDVRKQLMANLAHDLRAPASGILALTDTLSLKASTLSKEELQGCLQGLVASGESLERMVSELFEISRLESGETRISLQPTSPSNFLSKASLRFHKMAQESGIQFVEDFSNSLPNVTCDAYLIGRTLDNLLSNAKKFTRAGGTITLSANQEGDSVIISVADTGSGIPDDELQKIFERFHQVSTNSSDSYLGMGIGLAIVAHVMQKHGISMKVTSTLGQGSVFSFALPITAAQPSAV